MSKYFLLVIVASLVALQSVWGCSCGCNKPAPVHQMPTPQYQHTEHVYQPQIYNPSMDEDCDEPWIPPMSRPRLCEYKSLPMPQPLPLCFPKFPLLRRKMLCHRPHRILPCPLKLKPKLPVMKCGCTCCCSCL